MAQSPRGQCNVAGALAPRRLISLTKFPEAFEHTRTLYRLQRASEQFARSDSLPEALEVWKFPADPPVSGVQAEP